MTVYIDPPFVATVSSYQGRDAAQARRVGSRHDHQWSHLWTDPGNEEELHRVARAAGMKRVWFQPKPGFPHYDLVPSRRAAAIEAGAVERPLKDWLQARRSAL